MWTVVIHKSKCSEFNIIAKGISKANAQLFVEDYALSYVVEHDGNKEPTICKLSDVESIINDTSKTSLDKHYLIKNTSPWGFTVVRAVISLLETKITSEVDAVETVVEMQEHDVTREVVVPGKWYGKKIHTVVEKQMQPIVKQVAVKNQKTVLSHVRSSAIYQVFQINLGLDESAAISSPTAIDEVAKNNCKKFSEQLKLVPSFTMNATKLSQLRVKNPNDFATRNSHKAIIDMSKLLTRAKVIPTVWEQFDTVETGSASLNSIKPPARNQVFALACLNDDIIKQHKKMFNKCLPDHRETILTEEFKQYIDNTESSESDSDDWEESDEESDGHIFNPLELAL